MGVVSLGHPGSPVGPDSSLWCWVSKSKSLCRGRRSSSPLSQFWLRVHFIFFPITLWLWYYLRFIKESKQRSGKMNAGLLRYSVYSVGHILKERGHQTQYPLDPTLESVLGQALGNWTSPESLCRDNWKFHFCEITPFPSAPFSLGLLLTCMPVPRGIIHPQPGEI